MTLCEWKIARRTLTLGERTLSSRLGQIEAELSRLCSVVYLLVKDKPEMLHLLGQQS